MSEQTDQMIRLQAELRRMNKAAVRRKRQLRGLRQRLAEETVPKEEMEELRSRCRSMASVATRTSQRLRTILPEDERHGIGYEDMVTSLIGSLLARMTKDERAAAMTKPELAEEISASDCEPTWRGSKEDSG